MAILRDSAGRRKSIRTIRRSEFGTDRCAVGARGFTAFEAIMMAPPTAAGLPSRGRGAPACSGFQTPEGAGGGALLRWRDPTGTHEQAALCASHASLTPSLGAPLRWRDAATVTPPSRASRPQSTMLVASAGEPRSPALACKGHPSHGGAARTCVRRAGGEGPSGWLGAGGPAAWPRELLPASRGAHSLGQNSPLEYPYWNPQDSHLLLGF